MARSDALTRFGDWFDDRTGIRSAKQMIRDRILPDGPRWSVATGVSTLGLFVVVIATGLILMTGYSPAADHGWSSVFYLESTPGGSFLRGLHYYGSHALLVLFAFHLARAILTASFRAPRELAWISGVLLLPLLATAAVTGNPLSASNKAIGQIEVESHIVGNMPILGPIARDIMVGGSNVGHLTMTRLYSLHVAFLPLLAGILLVFHLYQHLRYGTASSVLGSTPPPLDRMIASQPVEDHRDHYWPSQTARNALVFGLIFGVVAILAWRLGVPLDAPADPTLEEMPRPEWYFRSLFELRNYVGPRAEVLATGVLPALFLAFLAALPWIDRLLPRFGSLVFRYAVVILAASGWTALTAISFARDREDEAYQAYLITAEERANRVERLAFVKGVPPAGPAALLQQDPKTQGPKLFKQHCASCHPHTNDKGEGIVAKIPAAPNLFRFASREWIEGLLDPERIASADYYGETAFVKEGTSYGMIDYVRDELFAVDDEELADRKEQVRKVVLALSAEASLPYQTDADSENAQAIAEGRALLAGDELGCINCHKFGEAGELGTGPDLTGYASRQWLNDFIANPAHERFYADNNDGMPAFHPAEPGSTQNILSQEELLLIVDWLRRDWIE